MLLRMMYVKSLCVFVCMLSVVLLHNAFASASVICDKLPNAAKLRSHYLVEHTKRILIKKTTVMGNDNPNQM